MMADMATATQKPSKKMKAFFEAHPGMQFGQGGLGSGVMAGEGGVDWIALCDVFEVESTRLREIPEDDIDMCTLMMFGCVGVA